ncbi:MAG: hypothetical protein ACC667_09485 [Longimicrobiales bacterium]
MKTPGIRRHRPGLLQVIPFLTLIPLLSGCSSLTEPLFTRWAGDLEPILPSAVSGQVAAISQFGSTQASIQIERGEAGVSYRWHIESGDCQGNGQIQGGVAVYPQLVPNEVGTAGSEATLSAVFESNSVFVARVFRSLEGGSEKVVACADLREVG